MKVETAALLIILVCFGIGLYLLPNAIDHFYGIGAHAP